MLRALDRLAQRFSEAYKSFVDPDRAYRFHDEGRDIGELIAFAKVRQQFDTYDPYQFDNGHFKLGYYYATEQAKKVMSLDEDNSVD